MSNYIASDTDLTAVANAIRTKLGTTAQLQFPSGFVSMVEAIPGGGSPQHGVVFEALNNVGQATEATFFGDAVPVGFFGRQTNTTNISAFPALKTVHLGPSVTKIYDNAFRYSEVENITGCVNVVALSPAGNRSAFAFATALKTISLPKVATVNNDTFTSCTALEAVALGSVGQAVTNLQNSAFNGCTQTGLVITVYTTGDYVDTAVANARNKATNATIVIKAAETTTYNGASYAAGATILTSEVAA